MPRRPMPPPWKTIAQLTEDRISDAIHNERPYVSPDLIITWNKGGGAVVTMFRWGTTVDDATLERAAIDLATDGIDPVAWSVHRCDHWNQEQWNISVTVIVRDWE